MPARSAMRFDAGAQGWSNHVRYTDTWGLHQHVLDTPLH